jgi:hypothetical protein
MTYNVLGETVTNGKLLRAIGKGAGCEKETRLPYVVAWFMAALAEALGQDGLTRAQVRALSRPMSFRGDRFGEMGFVAQTGWQEALERGCAWCVEN